MKRWIISLLFILCICSAGFGWTQELLLQQGHTAFVNDLAINPSGKRLASIASDRSLIFWTREGAVLRRISLPDNPEVLDFSPDGTVVAVLTTDRLVYRINTATYEILSVTRTGKSNRYSYTGSIKYLPDGTILVADCDSTVKVYSSDMLSKTREFSFQNVREAGPAVLSPNGKWLAVANNRKKGLSIVDFSTGREVYNLRNFNPFSVSFTSNSQHLVLGTPEELRKYSVPLLQLEERHLVDAYKLHISSNGDVFTGGEKGLFRRNLESRSVESISNAKYAFPVLERDGSLFYRAGDMVYRHDFTTKDTIPLGRRFFYVNKANLSPEGRYLVVATNNYTDSPSEGVPVIDLKDGLKVSTFKTPEEPNQVMDTVFSKDGSTLYAMTFRGSLYKFSVPSGKLLAKLKSTKKERFDTLSQDPNTGILVAGGTNGLELYDEHLVHVRTISVDPLVFVSKLSIVNGLIVASGDDKYGNPVSDQFFRLDGSRVSNVANAKHTNKYYSHLRIEESGDRVRFWSKKDNKLLFDLFISQANEAVAVTPEGYFSYSGDGILTGISFVSGSTTLPLSSFFERFYRPDIISARLAGKNIDNLVSTAKNNFNLPPNVAIAIKTKNGSFVTPASNLALSDGNSGEWAIEQGKITVRVTAIDAGGGINGVRLYASDKAIGEDVRGLKASPKIGAVFVKDFWVHLSEGVNTLQATGFSRDRTESTPLNLTVSFKSLSRNKPRLFVLAAGADIYRNSKYNLNFAVADVTGFSESLKLSAGKIFDKVIVRELLNNNLTAVNLRNNLEAIQKQATPQDVFILFYAGHGIAIQEGEQNNFYFVLPGVTVMNDVDKLKSQAFSTSELRNLVGKISANKQMLLIDACNSGAFLENFAVRGAAEENALAQLQRSAGIALFSASTDIQFANEVKELGHGLFTWALIQGIKGSALTKDGKITASSLKAYIDDEVPRLAQKYRGSEQFPLAKVSGQDFPIGVKVK